ncbi:MAG: CPXCG motif-containing cysteine-rich protein [Candidatus Latescibacterota bacterium]|nr:CPXCG motif-containing cysteine-rich protein [Candidatus Latescibacterota bacterium]
MLAEEQISCPYCGEMVDVFVDRSVPEQVYVEDCYVCCRPILLSVHVGADDEVAIAARQENG